MVMFAPHIRNASQLGYEFRQLHAPPQLSSQIYFANHGLTASLTQISAIAFQQSQPSLTYFGNLPALEPVHGCLSGWYYSSCRLSDVVEITPCRKANGLIIGMLLRYSNDHRECVGQYHLDRTTRSLQVSSKYLNIGLHAAGTGQQQVMELAVDTELFQASCAWKQIPWSGTLDWWFRVDVCVPHHPQMRDIIDGSVT